MQDSECRKWAEGDPLMEEYHDHEWCHIRHDDQFEFEMLCLEGASTGLSWRTILHKRKAYQTTFHHFDIKACAAMNASELNACMDNPGLIRNKSKIYSVRTNAQVVLKIQEEYGSFDAYLWQFADGKQIDNHWQNLAEIPFQNEISVQLSKDMKKRGMRYIGPVITYSFMQAIGMVNDHLADCAYRNQENA